MVEERVIVPVRVTPETRRQLKIHAAVHSTSINALLSRAVETILKGEAAAEQGKVAA